MMSLLLFLALLFHVNVTASHDELENVAYSKLVILSSKFSSHLYQGPNAVNGLLNDFTATAQERFPWIIIDLGGSFKIHEIEVFARSDCCGNQIHDLDIKVGDGPHSMNMCGHFTGPAFIKQRFAVFCPPNTVGRYVKLQIVAGNSNILAPAEVLVWGLPQN